MSCDNTVLYFFFFTLSLRPKVCLCSFIFWANRENEEEEEMKKGKRVLQCLQKALKVANAMMEPTDQASGLT